MEQNYSVQRRPESRSRKFWRIVFGSLVGFFLANILIVFLSIFIALGMVATLTTTSTPMVKNNSILKIALTGNIEERGEDNPFENTGLESYGTTSTGLDDILNCIAKAANDPNIKGISVEIEAPVAAGAATLKEIRDALEKFKNSGKFVYAYSEFFSQKAYYVASAADKVFVSPLGHVDLRGLCVQLMFYKGLLDKLDVDVQIARHGTYKSFVEPYIQDKMSPANREQMTLLVDHFWNVFANDIARNRNISVESVNLFTDQLLGFNPKTCKAHQLVDEIMYPVEYQDMLHEKLGIDKDAKMNTVTINSYRKTAGVKEKAENIAIVYAFGSIYDGKGDDKNIYSENICKEIRKAYQNNKVKAIVLRVNSGGGSAAASEMIWKEIELAKAAGKKVVTSMGDYAASGGYYISCNSDYIVAQPNTLTGSIGVLGLFPSLQKMLKNKLGITLDVAKSNPHADYLTGVGRPLDELEMKRLTSHVEEVYEIFTQRVADGRNLPIDAVYKIAEGRVWSGTEAIKIGLVDQLGTIEDAVAKAAELAELSNYGIICYPKQQDFFTRLFSKLDDETKIEQALQQQLGDLYFTYKGIKTITDSKGIQARIPFEIVICD
ncbi:MAG: signal peptide peptidase SppA [Bacteroidetes bacterium]|nr:signal peptide peptidase SppA [Bacteroidota bacterium]MCL1969044.1 signal peptide peptidase SppA [Bacteroidota bacterium]